MPLTEPQITPDLQSWFNHRWKPKMGAIDGWDVGFIAALLAERKPSIVAEIGCASGLSTAMMAGLLEQIGPAELWSFDLGEVFYADPTKRVGYFLDEAPAHPSVKVHVLTGKTSLDVASHISAPIDLCFIDAAHKHPWPLIDTLAVLPLMRPGGVIVHHDLRMYRGQKGYATGPKILLDQLLPKDRILSVPMVAGQKLLKTRRFRDNIYGMRVPAKIKPLARRLSAGFCIGWDPGDAKKLPMEFADRFAGFLSETYPKPVSEAFETGFQRYNPT